MTLIHNIKKPFIDFLKSIQSNKICKIENILNDMDNDSKEIKYLFEKIKLKKENNSSYDSNLVIANAFNQNDMFSEYADFNKLKDFNLIHSYLITNKILNHVEKFEFIMDFLSTNKIINCSSKIDMYDQDDQSNHFYFIIEHENEKALCIYGTEKYIVFKNKKGIHFRKAKIKDIDLIIKNGFKKSSLFQDLSGFDSGFISSSSIYDDLMTPNTEFFNQNDIELVLFNISSAHCSLSLK